MLGKQRSQSKSTALLKVPARDGPFTSSDFSFLDLAPEIRNEIYEYLLAPDNDGQAQFAKCYVAQWSIERRLDKDVTISTWNKVTGLLTQRPEEHPMATTCHQIRNEIAMLGWERTDYWFPGDSPWNTVTYSPIFRPIFLSCLRYLTLPFTMVKTGCAIFALDRRKRLTDKKRAGMRETFAALKGATGSALTQLTLRHTVPCPSPPCTSTKAERGWLKICKELPNIPCIALMQDYKEVEDEDYQPRARDFNAFYDRLIYQRDRLGVEGTVSFPIVREGCDFVNLIRDGDAHGRQSGESRV